MGLVLILTKSKKNPSLAASDPIVYMDLSRYPWGIYSPR